MNTLKFVQIGTFYKEAIARESLLEKCTEKSTEKSTGDSTKECTRDSLVEIILILVGREFKV